MARILVIDDEAEIRTLAQNSWCLMAMTWIQQRTVLVDYL